MIVLGLVRVLVNGLVIVLDVFLVLASCIIIVHVPVRVPVPVHWC